MKIIILLLPPKGFNVSLFVCLQELRIEDYEAGRKTGASATTGFSGLSTSTGSGGLFGNTSTAFGATSTFGQKPVTGFGTTTGMDSN